MDKATFEFRAGKARASGLEVYADSHCSLLKICQSVIAPYELALLSWLPGLRPLLKGEILSSVNVVQLANKIVIGGRRIGSIVHVCFA